MNGDNIKILIIEDNIDDEFFILKSLQDAGYHVISKRVENELALRLALEEEHWDAFVCDFHLPGMDAYRVREICQSYYDVPFLIVSGHIQEEKAVQILEAGAHDFVSKDNLFRLPLALKRELRQHGHRVRNRLDLEQAFDSVISSWGRSLQLRNDETQGHSERVTNLTVELARFLNLPKKDLVHIYRGALLHDIGKIGIPDAILLKPGRLDEQEMAIMQKHPQYAYDLLNPTEFLRLSIDIPYCHHEKWDGTGYPRGLKGEKIPLSARLFAVVDNFDALTSDRPYRSAWTTEKALEYIQEKSGTHFDPRVVEAFLSYMRSQDGNRA